MKQRRKVLKKYPVRFVYTQGPDWHDKVIFVPFNYSINTSAAALKAIKYLALLNGARRAIVVELVPSVKCVFKETIKVD